MFWEDFGAKTKKVETRGVLMVILYKDLFLKRKKEKRTLIDYHKNNNNNDLLYGSQDNVANGIHTVQTPN